MNTYLKGLRNENKAISEMEKLGFKCFRAKITRFNNNDFFGLFDIVAVKKYYPCVWIQVKSNSVKKKVIEDITNFAKENFGNQNIALIMVCHNRKGFETTSISVAGNSFAESLKVTKRIYIT